jgi:hypothetical protein
MGENEAIGWALCAKHQHSITTQAVSKQYTNKQQKQSTYGIPTTGRTRAGRPTETAKLLVKTAAFLFEGKGEENYFSRLQDEAIYIYTYPAIWKQCGDSFCTDEK